MVVWISQAYQFQQCSDRQVKLEHSSSINEDDHTYDKFGDHKKPKASETNEGNGNKEKDSAEYENEDEYDGTYIEQ